MKNETHTFFKCNVAAYHSEPGGTVTVRANLETENTVLLPAGVVYNFEEIGNMIRNDKAIVSVGVLNAFVERHGSLNELFERVDD